MEKYEEWADEGNQYLNLYCKKCGEVLEVPTSTTCYAKQILFDGSVDSFSAFAEGNISCTTCGSSDVQKELFTKE